MNAPVTASPTSSSRITALDLGDPTFKSDYGVEYAYVAGGMYKGIASKELVVALSKARLMSFLGTGGMRLEEIEAAIEYIQLHAPANGPYGMNLLASPADVTLEERTVDLYLRHGVRCIEAAAYVTPSPSIIKYRLTGARQRADGSVEPAHRVMAKISHPEVAAAFMSPAAPEIVQRLLDVGAISREEAGMAAAIPIADDICVEADSGGHTDNGVAYAVVPSILRLRDELMARYRYRRRVRVGAAGGIGTPEAAAASFILGADFVLTGSINQCTVEAGTSDAVKDLLQAANVQDTIMAPAGDMFEVGAKVQVLKKGTLFPGRASRLYELYIRHASLEEIDLKTRVQLEERYFRRSLKDLWVEVGGYHQRTHGISMDELERDPKRRMALIFRWYFVYATRVAVGGDVSDKANYQVQCGPAMGAFNSWVKGTSLESWRSRHAADIGRRIMEGAANLLTERFNTFSAPHRDCLGD